MFFNRLSLQIVWPIALVAVLALGLNAFLNLGKFERTLTELEVSRLRIVLGDLKSTLETGLDLGLPLSSLANAQAALDKAVTEDSDILGIMVYDEQGKVQFHSGSQPAPSSIPGEWLAHQAGKPDWQLPQSDGLVAGIALASNISSNAGGIALTYSSAAHQQVLQAASHQLLYAAAALALLAALLILAAVHFLSGPTSATLEHLEQALQAQELGQAGPAAGEPELALLQQARHTSDTAVADLELARKALQIAHTKASETDNGHEATPTGSGAEEEPKS
jgi:hypothetical protein